MFMNILIVLTIIYLLYKFSVRNFDYWEKRGVPYPKPLPFIGNVFDLFTGRVGIGHLLADFYNNYKTPYFGIYVFNKPYLILRNLELIKDILVKDFNYFPDRTVLCDEKLDSLASKLLFIAKNPEWKFLRSKISQAFSTGKIKNMFPLISAVAKEMNAYVTKNQHSNFIEAKELCAKYATEVVATCAFGINSNCFENEDAEFRVIGRKLFSTEIMNSVRQVAYFFAHGLVKFFKLPFFDSGCVKFMREMIHSTLENREKTQFKRNDVIDVIMQIRSKSNIQDAYKFEGDRIVAQAGQFFTAGFETVSTTMSFALYEMCLQQGIQGKIRSEIKDSLIKYGELTYEGIQEMKYLNMVVCETLRKYPVLAFLDRLCIQDYKIPGSDLVIEKGTPIYIPMFGLHYDPQYFPDPDKFDPERFSDENRNRLPSYAYIPFGEGPRVCIGERLGLVVSKLGLCYLLSQFEVARCTETPVPIIFETKGIILASTVGLPLKFQKSPIITT
ncbi:hypothetical protein ILUMI_18665 [Ignelater luminosus]|uniref:Cytochrome P450 n=1 Tax=Ignelater luminosus TaxID=2038154 RepID=A0A8K0CN54_IGNLU|nr:hypothetical protein ILUMI_18665 [Ignelater luminosus]